MRSPRISALLLVASLGVGAPLFAQDPVPESEPNNTPATANTARLGGWVTGHDDNSEDIDYWVLDVQAGDTIFVDVDASERHSTIVPSVWLYAADGTTVLDWSYSWDGLDPYLAYVARTTGRYFVAISGDLPGGHGPNAFYTIKFTSARCPVVASEHEPNNTLATARDLPLNTSVEALSCPNGDSDWYRLTVSKPTRLMVEMRT